MTRKRRSFTPEFKQEAAFLSQLGQYYFGGGTPLMAELKTGDVAHT
ncbi:hypothetical protein ATG98_2164 [Marinobacter sp. LV10R520-4]|jgi:transposase-like protein|nr:hypothetical protein ATG98_2164 [Marinobacter sp. LV10R520-4]